MKRYSLLILLLVLLVPALLTAQTTGKLRGVVVDKESGDALPGANVTIVGTTLGSATDVNGEFIILNVPAGTYDLKSSFIGYRDVTVKGVVVNAGLTKEVNFNLPTEALEGSEVTIVAERPLVEKNATSAVRIQTAEQIEKIPVRGVANIVALQPGVVRQDGDIYIRGGRRDEVGYFLEGASSRDEMTGRDAVSVIPEALEEIQVEAGGYTAEFGGANSGIIRQSLKSGTEQFHLSLQAETDNFADPGEQFLNTYSYGYSDYTVTASGPVPGINKLRFFVAGENEFRRDGMQRFWDGFMINHADTYIDENNFPLTLDNVGTGADRLAFQQMIQDQGLYTPNGTIEATRRERWTGNGTLVYDASPFIVRLGAALTYQSSQGGSPTNIPSRIFNLHRAGLNDLSTALLNLKFTHLVNPTTFWEANVNYYDRRSVSYDPLFASDKHNYWAYNDSIANAEQGVDFYTYFNPIVSPFGNSFNIHGFNFTAPGSPNGYGKSKRGYMGGSFALTTQYKDHEIKLGGNAEYHTVRSYSMSTSAMLNTARVLPDNFRAAYAGDDPAAVGEYNVSLGTSWRYTYGYDLWGNELNTDDVNGARHPQRYAAYLQDKFELSDLVINAGLRLDVIDNDDIEMPDPSNPSWDRVLRGVGSDVKKKDPAVELSPRLGLAFPVSDRTVFHMQYGKFVQPPRLDQMYAGDRYFDHLFTAQNSIQGPIGIGLDPQKTTQYDVGFSQQFADNASFDITYFYKNITDQIQVGRIVTDPLSPAGDYNTLVNGDFATTKGLELQLKLRRTARLAGQINYTFQSAKGTGSVNNSSIAGIEVGSWVPTVIQPLDFEQPQRGSVNLDYRFGKGDGGAALEQMGVNLLASFNSGHPYTLVRGEFGQQASWYAGQITDPRFRYPLEQVNASLTPWNFQLDLRLDKTIDFGSLGANFYVYVQNLTNRENVINVYNRTGNAYDDGFLADEELSASVIAANGGDAFVAMHEQINLNGNGTNYAVDTGNFLLGLPRIIRVGVRLQY
ncbi:MAG: TonB-dependent receptor [Deferribacteres bacterium]|nr:TonB-dependent receptor [candidate division KSB1 bacterium]MCB9504052.1 TonB-dependent receptor [Deferribacteres bacterium]